jgi:heptose-I-phosphate ethanolaminephosphotransferase
VLYQDRILDETIRLSQEAAKRQPVFWMFLSDHGVETGDWESRPGHSPNTPSGYRIPALLWASPSLTGGWAWDKVASRGFRADWLDDLLTAAAGIRWKGDRPQQSLIGERYDWEDPPSKQRFAKSAGQSKP